MNNSKALKGYVYGQIRNTIKRCEEVCDPAILDNTHYAVHVRKLPEEQGKGWVVRLIDKSQMDREKPR